MNAEQGKRNSFLKIPEILFSHIDQVYCNDRTERNGFNLAFLKKEFTGYDGVIGYQHTEPGGIFQVWSSYNEYIGDSMSGLEPEILLTLTSYEKLGAVYSKNFHELYEECSLSVEYSLTERSSSTGFLSNIVERMYLIKEKFCEKPKIRKKYLVT